MRPKHSEIMECWNVCFQSFFRDTREESKKFPVSYSFGFSGSSKELPVSSRRLRAIEELPVFVRIRIIPG